MNNRLSRILTRWMKDHPVYGLAPMCAAIEMDPGDETPLLIDGVRLPCTIYNDVDDDCLVKTYNPTEVPALGIIPQVTTVAPVVARRGVLDYKDVTVALSYMERDQPELRARLRGGYVLTAAMNSLLAFNENQHGQAKPIAPHDASPTWRRLGDVEIVEMTGLEDLRIKLGLGGSNSMFGSLLATFHVRRFL